MDIKRVVREAKQFPNVVKSGKSDACIAVLECMDKGFTYMSSVRMALNEYDCDRDELENELDKYI